MSVAVSIVSDGYLWKVMAWGGSVHCAAQQVIKFLTFHSTPPHLPDPPFRFSEGLAPRLNPRDVMHTVIPLVHTLVA